MTRRQTSLPSEVFLSHSTRDRRIAEKIAGVLRRHGVPVWYSEANIVGAKQWHDEIGRALARCNWFAVILSPHSIKSKWVKRELLFALNSPRYDNRIVPIAYKRCSHLNLSWTLGEFQFVDFAADFDDGCRSLLRVWGLGYQPGLSKSGS